MSWDDVFLRGIDLWLERYKLGEDYYKYEGDLWVSLLKSLRKASEERGLSLEGIRQEATVVGRTRVDFLLGNEVSLEVKLEPDYPGMPRTRKPVTNVVLKPPDKAIARLAGLSEVESRTRMYEVELDFLKLVAHRESGIPRNYLLCLDEDGRLFRNLKRSLRTSRVKRIAIPWKTIHRGKDKREVHYFLWSA